MAILSNRKALLDMEGARFYDAQRGFIEAVASEMHRHTDDSMELAECKVPAWWGDSIKMVDGDGSIAYKGNIVPGLGKPIEYVEWPKNRTPASTSFMVMNNGDAGYTVVWLAWAWENDSDLPVVLIAADITDESYLDFQLQRNTYYWADAFGI